MTFLEPMAGLLAGAWALPAVVLLYALRLRRLPLRVSSIRLWRRAERDVQANVPFRMPKPSWLLLLHLLIVALVVGAIARPALVGAEGGSSRVILVLDHSASMSALDSGTRSRLEIAQTAARRLLADVRRASGDQTPRVTVLAAAGRTTQRCEFSASPTILADAIDGIEPTDAPLNWESLASVLNGLLDQPEPTDADERTADSPPTVLLLTDRAVPASVRVAGGRGTRAIPLEAAHRANSGISAFRVERDRENPSLVRAFVRVHSTDASVTDLPVRLRLDDRVIASGTIPLTREPTEALTGVITLEVPRVDAGVMTAALPGDDALSADDRASAVLLSPTDARVLIVGPGERGADANPMLARALEVTGAKSVQTVGEAGYASALGLHERGAPWAVDLVVFDRLVPVRLPPCSSLHVGVPIARDQTSEPLPATRVLWWDRKDPLMRDVSLDALVVERPVRLEGVTGEVIARGRDGSLITVERGRHTRVVLWFDPTGGTWGRDVSFVVFMANTMEALTLQAERLAGWSFRTSDVVRLRARPDASEIAITGPTDRTIQIDPSNGQEPDVPIGILERVGIYDVTGAERVGRVPVNLLDTAATVAAGSPPAGQTGAGDAAVGAVTGTGVPRELWPVFLLGATVLLVVEWIVFGVQARV